MLVYYLRKIIHVLQSQHEKDYMESFDRTIRTKEGSGSGHRSKPGGSELVPGEHSSSDCWIPEKVIMRPAPGEELGRRGHLARVVRPVAPLASSPP